MRINGQAHAERLTRDAAQAIGRHVPDDAKWDRLLGGLQLLPRSAYCDNTFAPLNNPGDAYEVESKLKINVTYRALSNDASVLIMRASDDPNHASIMTTINVGDDALRLRMEAAVLFASLYLITTGA